MFLFYTSVWVGKTGCNVFVGAGSLHYSKVKDKIRDTFYDYGLYYGIKMAVSGSRVYWYFTILLFVDENGETAFYCYKDRSRKCDKRIALSTRTGQQRDCDCTVPCEQPYLSQDG